MVDAPWTAVHHSPNRSTRQPVARRGVVLHHAAMTSLDGLRRLAMGGKEVSATAICKDDNLELVVPDDDDRPWSLSSAFWDSALRSVETCNESVDGWTISDASHESLAHAVAYWAQTDGFWPHRDGDPASWTVLGHREVYTIHGASYLTACPGGLDLARVTARAQLLLTGAPQQLAVWQLEEKEMDSMFLVKIVDGQKKYGGGVIYALTGENGYWVEVRTPEAANALAKRFGDAANVTYAEWDAFKAAAA